MRLNKRKAAATDVSLREVVPKCPSQEGDLVVKQTLLAATLTALFVSSVAFAESVYSPYVEENYASQPLWGDTHLHTTLSLDARAFGVTLDPEQAYRLARGERVESTHGEKIQLSRPLDFLVVSDHSDGMGAMNEIIAGNPALLKNTKVADWHKRLSQGGNVALGATMEVIADFTNAKMPDVLIDESFSGSIWQSYLKVAEQFNHPGTFTTIAGYEWTSTENGNNLHRNVLYRGGVEEAGQMLPFTTLESFNPEDLWSWMARYEQTTGSQVLALAHNGNVSNGIMFPTESNPATGKPLTPEYASQRARWEPLYEVTQIKGDGESHPYLSTNDEFAGHDVLWDKANLLLVPKEKSMLQYEYAREALKNGLKLEQQLGVNPYKFGVIGSSDSHTALATAEESNFFGKHSGVEPDAERLSRAIGTLGDAHYMSWEALASGYAAVWAHENTREAIFDAMKRREVYATTGPRITLRFFGGWDFVADDANSSALAENGYSRGVPMGGELASAGERVPKFLISAIKDPLSGNLDRLQVIKGWLDAKGRTQERVYDVQWSDKARRQPNAQGKLPAVGNTVDVTTATWSNSIGAQQLSTVWRDPDFDPQQKAFYYVRVLEIPTPRWSTYDAVRYNLEVSDEYPSTIQERAYSSAIWYTP